MPLAPAIDVPPATPTTPVPTLAELPNPALPLDFEVSKANFREEMEKAGVAPTEPAETPEPETPAETAKPDETPAEAKPEPKKGQPEVPQELLDGKKAEPKVDEAIAEIDSMVLPKNAKPEQVASFGKLKETAKKSIEGLLKRTAELEQKQSDGASKAEIEAAQARVKAAEDKARELETTVERLAFTESPKFKAFVADETASLDGAKSYLNGTEINPDIIDLAAHNSGQKRLQVLRDAGLEGDQISAVAPYLAQYDSIQRNKAAAMDNWKTESQQYQEQERAKAEQGKTQRTAEEDRVWSTVLSKAENELLPFRKSDGNEPWNVQREELKQKAKRVFNGEGVPLDELADTIAKGVAYTVLDRVVQDLRERNNALTAENTKLKAAKPSASDSEGLKPDAVSDLTPEERAKYTFRQEAAKVGHAA